MPASTPICLALALLGGCGTTEATVWTDAAATTGGTTTGGTEPGTTIPTCTATVVSVLPTDGATEVATTAEITLVLSDVPDDGAWSLAVAGGTGQTTLAEDGLSIHFVPDSPWAGGSEIVVDAEVCGTTFHSTFQTVAGIDPASLVGHTYVVPYADLVWETPTNAGIISPDIDVILAQVLRADGSSLGAAVGGGTYGLDGVTVEPWCDTVNDAGDGDFSLNPLYSVGPLDFGIPVGDVDLTIENFTLFAEFAPDGASLSRVHVTGQLDVRALGFGSCALVGLLAGGNCVACSDGEVECLEAIADAENALLDPTLDLGGTCL